MLYANYIEQGSSNNDRFNLSNEKNINDRSYTYWLLREALLRHLIELNTPDRNIGKDIAFELHMNVMPRKTHVPSYVLLMETGEIYPLNRTKNLQNRYKKIFTWNDDWVDDERYIKINFPNKPFLDFQIGWEGRNKFCCVIAGNKSCAINTKKDLYSERVKAIRWFEKNAPDRFDLYGTGWESPPPPSGFLGRIWRKTLPIYLYFFGKNAFPSYRGRVARKDQTLSRYRFAICYENVRDVSGYITEKVFDCFFSGCIPIYWGASNITDYIPAECFIDKRNFENYEDLYMHLDQMPLEDYINYQKSILSFLKSPQARNFFSECFVDKIVKAVLSDLSLLHAG